MIGRVEIKKFKQIDLTDPFFDSLKGDYQEFVQWFSGKAEKEAYVIYNDELRLDAFLYVKTEPEQEHDNLIVPPLPQENRLKLATIKVAESGQGNKFGEGLLKIAFDIARQTKSYYIYVTVFPKYDSLIRLLLQMGFEKFGFKNTGNGTEDIYIHKMANKYNYNHPIYSYPFIPRNPERPVRIVPIEAEYHSLLFPDSQLQGAINKVENYIPASNAIRKIYIAKGSQAGLSVKGELLFFYRKRHQNEPGPSKYKSAITTIGIVENVYREGADYRGLDEFLRITGRRTAFTIEELSRQYREGRRIIIQFLYILSFGKGHNVNYQTLLDHDIINPDQYWGFLPILNDKYQFILREASVNDSYFID